MTEKSEKIIKKDKKIDKDFLLIKENAKKNLDDFLLFLNPEEFKKIIDL